MAGRPAGDRRSPAARVDGRERARGEAVYTANVQLPGMLHTAVLRSPHANARVTKLDLSRALEAPGVRAALTPDDLDVLTREPGYPGAAVAAIAADTLDQAEAARELVDVEWDVLQPLLDPEEAVEKGSLIDEPERYERGDVEKGLAEADVVVEAEYRTQTVLHNSMETHQSVCQWEVDVLNLYTSTQFIWGVREETAEKLGIPQDNVRVICNYMGGGFGAKNHPGEYTFIAAELAKRTGRPVRCALTRKEENLASGNRHATVQRLRAGAKADGTLTVLSRRLRHGRRLPRLQELDGGADEDAVRVPECLHGRVRREAQHRPERGLPRPRIRRGDVRPRVPAGRARRQAGDGSARGPAPQPRRQ